LLNQFFKILILKSNDSLKNDILEIIFDISKIDYDLFLKYLNYLLNSNQKFNENEKSHLFSLFKNRIDDFHGFSILIDNFINNYSFI
jgi:hypothetical protein